MASRKIAFQSACHDGPVILDLDRAVLACPAEDFGSFLACLLAEPADSARVASVMRELSAGYRSRRRPPDRRAIAVHAAAQLLRRASEPFRRGDPQWYATAAHSLRTAQMLLRDGPWLIREDPRWLP